MYWPTDYLYKVHTSDCIKLMKEIPDDVIDLIVTSPPYNCRKDYGDVPDEIPWGNYYRFLGQFLDEAYRVLRIGGTIAIIVPLVIRWQQDHQYRHTWFGYDPDYNSHRAGTRTMGKARIEPLGFRLYDMMGKRDNHLREPIVWMKNSSGQPIATTYQMGCDSDPYARPTHEYILLGSKGQWFHRGGTGRRGKDALPYDDYTKDVWCIQPITDQRHPAPFPIELPLRLIRLFTHAPDAIVLDPFMGVGSTALAAVKTSRPWLGVELNPGFAKIANSRATLAASQTTLPFMKEV